MALTASKHIKVAGGLIVAPKGKRMNAIPGLQMYIMQHTLFLIDAVSLLLVL